MRRSVEKKLAVWKESKYRKPLILRGARQVGKTYTISQFGNTSFDSFVCFDFEQEKKLHCIFESDLHPDKMIMQLESHAEQRIVPGKTLVFFDEIQACPRALASLRYFYEQCPKLHLIAAGSLLEFALGEISFPVGRVEFEWMYPLSFVEFLEACDRNILKQHIPNLGSDEPVAPSIHEAILEQLRYYFLVGGMPEAVRRFVETASIHEVSLVHSALIQSYQQDFLKYGTRVNSTTLERLMEQIPRQTGMQIKYSRLDPDLRIDKIKDAIQVLERALVIHRVHACAAQGLPLGAAVSDKIFKFVFLDIGLMQHLCGINAAEVLGTKDLMDSYRGALAEQFVGQELLCNITTPDNRRLYYWSRAQKNSNAEIDYLLVCNGSTYAIEVKSGPTGKLRSLQVFLGEHPHCQGVVCSTQNIQNASSIEKIRFLPLYTVLNSTS